MCRCASLARAFAPAEWARRYRPRWLAGAANGWYGPAARSRLPTFFARLFVARPPLSYPPSGRSAVDIAIGFVLP